MAPESFPREVPEGSKAPGVYGKRNADAVIEARQRRLYRRQLEGLPARQLVYDHADRESVSISTAWKDWKAVNKFNEEDFSIERETMVSRLAAMRFRAINSALRNKNFQSAAQMMDSLGKVVGESMPEQIAINTPELKVTIEDNKKGA